MDQKTAPMAIQTKKSAFKTSSSPNKSSLEERLFTDVPPPFSRKNSVKEDTSNLVVSGSLSSVSKHTEEKGKIKSNPTSPLHVGVPLKSPNLPTAPASSNPKKSQKEMTKAERRLLQEKQRAEKMAKKTSEPTHDQISPLISKRKESALTTSIAKQNSDSGKTALSIGSKFVSLSNLDQIKSTKPKTSKTKSDVIQAGSLFSHLHQYEKDRLSVIETKAQSPQIHPMIHTLGLQYASFEIVGGNARCLAMMKVFKKVISDYTTPPGITLLRHLTTYLGKQIDYLHTTRALATSMKHAIRHVKGEISLLSIDLLDEDAKKVLCDRIEDYCQHRIIFPMKIIKENTASKVQPRDVILTFGFSSTVYQVFENARQKNLEFEVVIVDSRPKFEGKQMLKRLVDLNISCTYVLLNGIGAVMKKVTKVLIGASGVLSNGAVMSRAGTAVIAMMAHMNKVPVIVCAETYKFSETVRLDSFVWNEIGDPYDVVMNGQENQLKSWPNIDKLSVLNLYYDVTPSQYITMVSCEHGFISSTSVPTVLREMGQSMHFQ